jgi:hypothetical protein
MARQPAIVFTKAKYQALLARYAAAVEDGEDRFLFEGVLLFTAYAKHLPAYLAGDFGDRP